MIAFSGAQAPLRDSAAWRNLEPSIVVLLDGERTTGAAALIDSSEGFFVAHRASLSHREVNGRLSSGKVVKLTWRGSDGPSQLVLLQADQWIMTAKAIVGSDRDERPKGEIFAVLASGPIRAEYVGREIVGVLNPSRRLVPMSEIRFESQSRSVGGALLLTMDGQLVGALNATLENPGIQNALRAEALISPDARDSKGLAQSRMAQLQNYNMPGQLTVGYTAGPDVLRRVIRGFRSPGHRVEHPTLGVLCLDAPGGGALVQRVDEKSAAKQAGIRVGDVLLDINGTGIRNQIGFAQVMFRQSVGAKIPIRLQRGTTTIVLEAIVGGQQLSAERIP